MKIENSSKRTKSKKELCKFPLNPGLKLDIQRGCPKLMQEENVKQISYSELLTIESLLNICAQLNARAYILKNAYTSLYKSIVSQFCYLWMQLFENENSAISVGWQ